MLECYYVRFLVVLEIQNRFHGYYSRKLDQQSPSKSTNKVPAKSNTGSLDKKKGFAAPVLCQIVGASSYTYSTVLASGLQPLFPQILVTSPVY